MILLLSLSSFWIGFFTRDILNALKRVEAYIKTLKVAEKLKDEEEAQSVLVEPKTAMQLEREEMDKRIKELNQ